MKKSISVVCCSVAFIGVAAVASAQPLLNPQSAPKTWATIEPVSLSGPRFGMTFLGDELVDRLLDEHDITVGNVVSQFGWQLEKRIYANRQGLTALTEAVVLVGGLEQGVVLPSLNWLAGIRTAGGSEFGIGPNITPLGVGLVVAAGTTFKAGALNIPVNLAVVPSKSGVRVSFLTGFNMRRR